jgi:hypothetical protein
MNVSVFRRLLPRAPSPTAQEALICLSVASLCLHKAWTRVLRVQDVAFELQSPTYKPIGAILCAILALAILFWIARLVTRQLPWITP